MIDHVEGDKRFPGIHGKCLTSFHGRRKQKTRPISFLGNKSPWWWRRGSRTGVIAMNRDVFVFRRGNCLETSAINSAPLSVTRTRRVNRLTASLESPFAADEKN